MFDEIRICGLGSIAEAVLELHPGLTVLSGETGAGKSSVVRAFGLLAGGRADVAQIRAGSSSAAVEARLVVAPDGPIAARVAELGGEIEGGSLLIARTVALDGRSRAFVGGRAVPVGLMAEVVGALLALHGQSSQLQLRAAEAQRSLLDRFAGAPVLKPLAEYHAARERWLVARREQAELRAQDGERAREVELLRLGLAEVERVAPLAGEDRDLDRELDRLAAADELRSASETARLALAGGFDAPSDDGGAVAALAFAARSLDTAGASDPELAGLSVRAHEVCVVASELAAELSSYAAGVDDDPLRLAAAQERRDELSRLCRPHGTDVDGVLRWAAEAGIRLHALDGGGERCSALAAAEVAAAEQMLALAAVLSAARRSAAEGLGRRVSRELAALSMTAAQFMVSVEARPDVAAAVGKGAASAEQLGADGGDEIEFLFTPGAGMSPRPLAKSASGGELSRVVLALEVVLAAGLGPASMVFDEVDAGIGGEAAVEVGRRLGALGRARQVICVTHLPQVAAFADRHLLVAKGGRGRGSSVQSLEQHGRVQELSRMLAGVSDSELAQGHAAELLAAAAAAGEPAKANPRKVNAPKVNAPKANAPEDRPRGRPSAPRAVAARVPTRKRSPERPRAAAGAS
ncbi:MAG TPA: DNA repair protein RecN [Frankiaceae bacterium]|jgi:DNA repair protein RecN (Recombination protein N)|nr:DNA repair protein RecN [Frankiaceae bacterium]